MIVCVCNVFNDRQVRAAIRGGAQTVSQVYQRLGYRPRCGKCVPEIVALLKEHRAELARAAPLMIAAE